MGLIATSKFGDCCQCGAKDTNVVKVKKDTYCLSCNRINKVKNQMAKQREKVSVRSLNNFQREEGIVDSVAELRIDADRIFSRYIRLRDMESDGKITCYICGQRVKWEKAHAMHFIDRRYSTTRYLFQNVKSGCWNCNVGSQGNLKQYAKKLEEEQKGIVDWLEEQKNHVFEYTRNDMKELLIDLQHKLKLVETKLK